MFITTTKTKMLLLLYLQRAHYIEKNCRYNITSFFNIKREASLIIKNTIGKYNLKLYTKMLHISLEELRANPILKRNFERVKNFPVIKHYNNNINTSKKCITF